MNLKELLFGRLRATTKASTTTSVFKPEATLLGVSTTAIMFLIVAAVSFFLGFCFWALVVIFKRRRRSRQVRLQEEFEMIAAATENQPQQLGTTTVDQLQQQATTTVYPSHQAAQPSNQGNRSNLAASLRKITVNQTIPVPTHLKRQSKVPVRFGGDQ
jgi:hypothetical protein